MLYSSEKILPPRRRTPPYRWWVSSGSMALSSLASMISIMRVWSLITSGTFLAPTISRRMNRE